MNNFQFQQTKPIIYSLLLVMVFVSLFSIFLYAPTDSTTEVFADHQCILGPNTMVERTGVMFCGFYSSIPSCGANSGDTVPVSPVPCKPLTGGTCIPGEPGIDAMYRVIQTCTVQAHGTPTISVTPASQNFNNVTTGSYGTRSFIVENTGSGTLSGSVSGLSGRWSCSSGCGQYSLDAGETQIVSIRFSPVSGGGDSDTAVFSCLLCSNGPNVSRGVSGTGVLPTGGISTQEFYDVGSSRADWFSIRMNASWPNSVSPGQVFDVSATVNCWGDDYSGTQVVTGYLAGPNVEFPGPPRSINCPSGGGAGSIGSLSITAPMTPGTYTRNFFVRHEGGHNPAEQSPQLIQQGTISYEVVAAVPDPPIVDLKVNLFDSPPAVTAGTPVNISWDNSAGGTPTSCSGDGAQNSGWNYVVPGGSLVTGSDPANFDTTGFGGQTINFRLNCSNGDGNDNETVSLTVNAPTPTVSVTASALNPATGVAPLNNVDIRGDVSGTATGNIRYRMDCTNDGTWERDITNAIDPYTAVDLCDYVTNGTYTVRVRVDRQGVWAEDTTTVTVSSAPSLSVTASALNPATGPEPLNNVDIRGDVAGTATGNIRWQIDCTDDGTWERDVTNATDPYTAVDLCDYASNGTYTARVRATRGGLLREDTTLITVSAVPPTVSVTASALNPSTGSEPLNNVDIRGVVGGTATGNVRYRMDCTDDGTWDYDLTTSLASWTAIDLCDYANDGTYTVRVRVDRQGVSDEDTTTVTVNAAVGGGEVTLSANPTSLIAGGFTTVTYNAAGDDFCVRTSTPVPVGNWNGGIAVAGAGNWTMPNVGPINSDTRLYLFCDLNDNTDVEAGESPTPVQLTVSNTCSPNGSGYDWMDGSNVWVPIGPTTGWNWDPTTVSIGWNQPPPNIAALETTDVGFDIVREWMINFGELRCVTGGPPPPTACYELELLCDHGSGCETEIVVYGPTDTGPWTPIPDLTCGGDIVCASTPTDIPVGDPDAVFCPSGSCTADIFDVVECTPGMISALSGAPDCGGVSVVGDPMPGGADICTVGVNSCLDTTPCDPGIEICFTAVWFGSCAAPLPACSNGLDDDADGQTDFPNDPGCTNANDNDETDPALPPPSVNLQIAPVQSSPPFTDGPLSVDYNSSIFIRLITDAVSCSTTDSPEWFTDGTVPGTLQFDNLTANRTFNITCENASGVPWSDSVTVNVGDAPDPPVPDLLINLSNNPSSITAGDPVTLSWTVTGDVDAGGCSISTTPNVWSYNVPSGQEASGNTSPSSAAWGGQIISFTLTCTGPDSTGGESDTPASLTVDAASPVFNTLSDNSPIANGGTGSVTWGVSPAQNCVFSTGGPPLDTLGSIGVSTAFAPGLTQDLNYEITCTNLGVPTLSGPRTIGVQPLAPPISSDLDFVAPGGQVTLTWGTSAGTGVECDGLSTGVGDNWPTPRGIWNGGALDGVAILPNKAFGGGSQLVGPILANTTFTITCVNQWGAPAPLTATVEIIDPIASITALPQQVLKGRDTTVVWEAVGVLGECLLAKIPRNPETGNLIEDERQPVTNISGIGTSPRFNPTDYKDESRHDTGDLEVSTDYEISCPTIDIANPVMLQATTTISTFIPGFDEE